MYIQKVHRILVQQCPMIVVWTPEVNGDTRIYKTNICKSKINRYLQISVAIMLHWHWFIDMTIF